VKNTNAFLSKLGALLGSAAIRGWMRTLDYKAAFYDRRLDPAFPGPGQNIYLFWHEYILFPLYLRGHCNMTVLLSRHADAEILSQAARYLGYDFVRGSTRRGGVSALRKLLRERRKMHLAITPDGPRGPRRRLAPGAIYLASKLGMPLVLLGFGFDRPWRVRRAWDRFAIPRPGSRARCVVSPEIRVPPELDRQGIEHFRARVERLLRRLTAEAEAWAESGTRKLGQFALGPRYATPLSRTQYTPSPLGGPHWLRHVATRDRCKRES